jgi:hypothetical protein
MKIDLLLAYLFKFVTFVLFSFMILVYAGLLVLLPLDILFQVVRLLAAVGLPILIAIAAGIGALGFLGCRVYNMPTLYRLVLDVGWQLVGFARDQIKRYDALIESTRGSSV